MSSVYVCCRDDFRRNAVRDSAALNGIDFLEVVDEPTDPPADRQRKLRVHFLKALAAPLGPDNVVIRGGERVLNPPVKDAIPSGDVLEVVVSEAGDFSPYTLRLVADSTHDDPPAGIDPLLGSIEFSFKVECPTRFDCKPERECPPPRRDEPEIDYLAKDYSSFRRLMLDRLSALAPGWQDRNAADLGIALVELLAYVGDQLSYFQDAVANEAYLATARRRVSVRRHARLVDYLVHDGCNARAWVQVLLTEDTVDPGVPLPAGTPLLTSIPGVPPRVEPEDYREALGAQPDVFLTMYDAVLFRAHHRLDFYAWGSRECCLPSRSTRATLRGDHSTTLRRGDVLVLEEVLGPETGSPADADPAHRHAVRLVDVQKATDPLGRVFDDGEEGPLDVTEIRWSDADALPFPLCISARTEDDAFVDGVSCARGNIVLADHGRRVKAEGDRPEDRFEQLGTVPEPTLFAPVVRADRCAQPVRLAIPPRFSPTLAEAPLTHAAPYDHASAPSAAAAMRWETSAAVPAITLHGLRDGDVSTWDPARDLLDADPSTPAFVVEIEDDGTVSLRFGDDRFGLQPNSGTSFAAEYRVGNGTQGNVGAASIAHVASDERQIAGVRNPLPAQGGVDPESAERARQNAPSAFRTQQRAVTAADYGEIAERNVDIQRAAATLRWTGSWRTMFVSVDRLGGRSEDNSLFRHQILRHLDRFRMAGQDVEVDLPRFVSLEIAMFVCVQRDRFRADVEKALRAVFSDRTLPDGTRGVFHPDNFTFGQPVYLSPLYAVAQAVPGVQSVEIETFQRQGAPSTDARETGVLEFGRLEIPRLEQNPDFPEHGKLTLRFGGGK